MLLILFKFMRTNFVVVNFSATVSYRRNIYINVHTSKRGKFSSNFFKLLTISQNAVALNHCNASHTNNNHTTNDNNIMYIFILLQYAIRKHFMWLMTLDLRHVVRHRSFFFVLFQFSAIFRKPQISMHEYKLQIHISIS